MARVGQGVNLAVERFVTVGETIADDNPEIKQEMYEACKEARNAGESNHCYSSCVLISFLQLHTPLCVIYAQFTAVAYSTGGAEKRNIKNDPFCEILKKKVIQIGFNCHMNARD